jgi:hypothetical protein
VFLLTAFAAALGGVVNAAGDDVVGASVTPIQIKGCWIGDVTNDSFGNTTVEFLLDQRGDRIVMVKRPCPGASSCGSSILFGDLGGTIGGKVSSTGFTFHGRVRASGNPAFFPVGNRGCGIIGQGVLEQDGSIEGSYSFRGKCAGNGGDFKVFAACS